MRANAERPLLVLVIVVSLVLTGLTIWAVAGQGRALQQRELMDLRAAAATAAAQREAAVVGDLQRGFDAAARAWQLGGSDELDAWAGNQRIWLLACMGQKDGPWAVLPRTLLEPPASGPNRAPEETPPRGSDLLGMLEHFKRLAGSSDPLTRAGALLGTAACEQQLGHPLAAARVFADAAQFLRSTPGLARLAFRAELSRIDALLAAGEATRAHEAYGTFVRGLLGDHPARLGETELARLQQQAAALSATEALPDVALRELERRVARRQAVADTALRLLPGQRPQPAARSDEVEYRMAQTSADGVVVVAVRAIAEDANLALTAPVSDLLTRYWKVTPNEMWIVQPPGTPTQSVVLAQLGPSLGGAFLEVTPATFARLQATARRHLRVILATAAGTAAAWLLVIWTMIRVVARQRELVRLQRRFVADVSHELKTPLALIRLLSETLAAKRVRDPERIQSYHQTITRESERLSVLLDNILDFSRIESGAKRYTLAPCDIAAAARQAWALFEPQFAADGFDARLELADGLPPLRGDAQALQQVIVNLLQNAHRYAGTAKFVGLSVARDGQAVVITVEDHGIGMTRDQLEQLGDSFFRAEDSRVRQTRGTGLGLAIVSHIVAAHHGKIDVHSRPGEGSRFTIWLPCEPVGVRGMLNEE